MWQSAVSSSIILVVHVDFVVMLELQWHVVKAMPNRKTYIPATDSAQLHVGQPEKKLFKKY
jgi:hypothetical protein